MKELVLLLYTCPEYPEEHLISTASEDAYKSIAWAKFREKPCILAGQAMKKEDVLALPCDVLVPAAIGGVITEHNADSLQCKFLVEAANGPTTPEGDKKLRERGVVVLPDIYTNGGKYLQFDFDNIIPASSDTYLTNIAFEIPGALLSF